MTAVASLSPAPFQVATQDFGREASLTDFLANLTTGGGLVWLQQAGLPAICSRLSVLSNSTLTLSAAEGSVSCVDGPPGGYLQASLAVPFRSGQVVLWAWESEGQ